MLEVKVVKDEWTPAIDKMLKALEPKQRRRFFGDLGQKIVFSIRQHMDKQLGWGNKRPYKRLKIKWRYHGRKGLLDNARNRKKINWNVAGEMARALNSPAGTVSVVDKTKVDKSSIALQDLGDLYRSWDATKYGSNGVTVRPTTAKEAEKAWANDPRGDWSWKKKTSGEVFERFLKWIDEEALGLK